MKTPIPESVLELRRTMPQWDGKIVDPRYVPEAHRESYLTEWGQWLRNHPKSQWEPWMESLVQEMKARANGTSRGKNLIASFARYTPATENIGTFANHAAVDD